MKTNNWNEVVKKKLWIEKKISLNNKEVGESKESFSIESTEKQK